jgi:hypothetical protein
MAFWHFMMGGGWSIWFVLLFAGFTLAAAVGFMLRPEALRLDAVRSFSWATTFSILSGVCLNLAAVGSKAPVMAKSASSPPLHVLVMDGIAESVVPAILGFMLLSLAWTLVGVGQRRLAREAA